MAGKSIFGSSVSMSNEFNFKGKKTEIKSKGKACTPVKMSDLAPPVDISPFVPLIMASIPVCSGTKEMSPFEQSVMGAIGVAGTIQITQDPQTAQYVFNYILSLLKVMNGASAKNGRLSEEELKRLLMSLMSGWLEESGPGFVSYNQILMDLMQNATLQDFMKGMQNAVCAMTGDPVNANTGNFIYEKEDLLINGRLPICFKRFYNSTDKRTGVMGDGWRHNYEIQLLQEKDRYVILWEDGREEIYLRDKGDTMEPLFGHPCRLKLEKEGYCYETQEKIIFSFDNKGKLLKKEYPNGQGLLFAYDKKERLSRVSNRTGAFLSYEYDSFCDYLCKVIDHSGRCITFTYETNRLKEVRNAAGQAYFYYYGPDKRICKIRNPRGIYVLENSYDDLGRTVAQSFADGGKIQYDYQDSLSRTLVTEQNGNKVAYVHDENFRNVKTIYIDGEESFTYNNRNQLISKTDKNGNKTKLSYDDKGNKTQIIFPDGEKHNMTYDAANHLFTHSINGVKKVKNTYDAKGNLIKTSDALDRCREVKYDEVGNAVKVKQPDGSEIKMEYDVRGNITSITDGTGQRTSYEYDECNHVIRVIDGNGNPTKFAYDNSDQITSIINAEGNRRTYEYAKNGKVTKVTDFNGAVTVRDYNNMNQVKSITNPDGKSTYIEYDRMQNITKRLLPNGGEVSYTYDNLNRLEQLTLPTNGTIRYEYDPSGNRTAVIDPVGNRTVMEYDERNRLIRVTDPAGAATKYEYDMEGHVISITNANGKQHTYFYDEAGQLVKEIDILGNTSCYEYNSLGKLASIIDPKKHRQVYKYHPGGRLSKTIAPDGKIETYCYDQNGNLIRRQNHKGDYLEFTYDCLNQLVKVKSSLGQEMRYNYNAAGKITDVTDALDHITHYEYSSGGNLTSVVDAAGNRTEYAYDTMGELITICQHEGSGYLLESSILNIPSKENKIQVTQYERNLMGKIETIINPLGLQEYYSYDLAGRMCMKIDREGNKTQNTYNPVGDIETIVYGDGRSVAFTYNSLRQLIHIQDWLGIIQIEPDDMGRVKTISDYKGRKFAYQWGSMGERESLMNSDGKITSYEYDEWSRLISLVDGKQKIQYFYNEDGRLCEKTFPEGITSSYQYNAMGLVSGLIHQKNGEILEQYEYKYDLMGNKTAIRKKRESVFALSGIPAEIDRKMRKESGNYQYKYDCMNRLTEVWQDRERVSLYEYDAFSNRISLQEGENKYRYHYNTANQLIRKEGGGAEEIFHYDARGNLTDILHGTEMINQYAYDETNRLSAAFNSHEQAARYQYDGLGNRVGVQEYSGIKDKNFIFETSHPSVENPSRKFDYMLDLTKQYNNLLKRTETVGSKSNLQEYAWDHNAVFMTDRENTHIYLQDELGSTMRLVGTTEKQQIIYGYNEFGQDLYGTQGEKQPFGYTGYSKDSIANTYFAQAREYLPGSRRFSGEDRIKGKMTYPHTLNKYGYCWNNPLYYIDSNGCEPQTANKHGGGGRSFATPETGQNMENMMNFFGVTDPKDLPELPDNAMVFVENVTSVGPIIRGSTIVMDYDKHCEYIFWGAGTGTSLFDSTETLGYVYNVKEPGDYAGLFLGASLDTVSDVKGGAVAPSFNKDFVYSEIIYGQGVSANASAGITWYITKAESWTYGKANINWHQNYYNPLFPGDGQLLAGNEGCESQI